MSFRVSRRIRSPCPESKRVSLTIVNKEVDIFIFSRRFCTASFCLVAGLKLVPTLFFSSGPGVLLIITCSPKQCQININLCYSSIHLFFCKNSGSQNHSIPILGKSAANDQHKDRSYVASSSATVFGSLNCGLVIFDLYPIVF